MSGCSTGPWRLERDWTLEVRDRDGRLVATVRVLEDARLIVAALELRAVLEKLCEYAERLVEEAEYDDPLDHSDDLRRARELLARVDGTYP